VEHLLGASPQGRLQPYSQILHRRLDRLFGENGVAYLLEASEIKKKSFYKLKPGAACQSRLSLCLRTEPRIDKKVL
jgi:hypothetical protein